MSYLQQCCQQKGFYKLNKQDAMVKNLKILEYNSKKVPN